MTARTQYLQSLKTLFFIFFIINICSKDIAVLNIHTLINVTWKLEDQIVLLYARLSSGVARNFVWGGLSITTKYKKAGKWMLLCYTVGYNWVTV